LDVSEETVRQLKQRAVIPGAPRGQMDLDLCRVAYLRHLRERAAGRASEASEDDGFDLVSERARLAKEQADHWATRNAQIRGDLAPPADITLAVRGLIELSKARLMRVPAKVAQGDGALRTLIADAIEDALSDLTRTRVEEEAATRPGGDGEDEAAEE
jgi:phage terminase Nu1 subunit (DNA packaging protein)